MNKGIKVVCGKCGMDLEAQVCPIYPGTPVGTPVVVTPSCCNTDRTTAIIDEIRDVVFNQHVKDASAMTEGVIPLLLELDPALKPMLLELKDVIQDIKSSLSACLDRHYTGLDI